MPRRSFWVFFGGLGHGPPRTGGVGRRCELRPSCPSGGLCAIEYFCCNMGITRLKRVVAGSSAGVDIIHPGRAAYPRLRCHMDISFQRTYWYCGKGVGGNIYTYMHQRGDLHLFLPPAPTGVPSSTYRTPNAVGGLDACLPPSRIYHCLRKGYCLGAAAVPRDQYRTSRPYRSSHCILALPAQQIDSMKKYFVARSRTHGKGLFATDNIKKDERISFILGKRVRRVPKTNADSRTMRTWFGLSRQFWIDPQNTPFRYLNHSCAPNAGIIGTKTLVAVRRIRKGEEITIDYSVSDADPYLSMKCVCGSRQCRKIIRAIQTLSPDVYKSRLPYVPRYFQQLYLRRYDNWGLQYLGRR